MINIPARYANLLKKDEVPKELVIHFPNGEHTDLTNEDIIAESMKFVESAGDTDTIKFGISDTPYIELDVVGVPDLSNSDIEVKLICDFSAYGGDDDYEINIGKFKISKMQINYNSDIVHILAYDSTFSDLSSEDITSDFFRYVSSTSNYRFAHWTGPIERYLDEFADNRFSEYYEMTEPVEYEKELVSDYTYTAKGHGSGNNYWTRVDVTVQKCDYSRSFDVNDYYYYRERGEDDYSFISRDDAQAISDCLSDRNNLPAEYPRLSNPLDYSERGSFMYSKYLIEGLTGSLNYFNDGNGYKLLTQKSTITESVISSGHVVEYSLYIGIGTYTSGSYHEPTSWTLVQTRTYSRLQLSDFLDVSSQTIKMKKFLFGVDFPLIKATASNIASVYNAMSANYPTDSTGFSKSVMWNMIAEVLGKMCRVSRADGSVELYSLVEINSLYPSDELFPSDEIFPQESNSYDISLSMYEFLNYQGDRSKKIGKVVIGSNGQYTAQVEDYSETEYASVTIDSGNIFVKGIEELYGANSDELKDFADAILDNYKNYEFIPYECTAVGLPFIQAGDFIVVEDINHDRKKFYIARRTLSGIQALKDDYSAGGLS